MPAITPLANAYPSSAMSAAELLIMTLVIVASLAAWLGLVFYAARQPRRERAQRVHGSPAKGIGEPRTEAEEKPRTEPEEKPRTEPAETSARPANQISGTGRSTGRRAA